jgi:hypothetical protein
LRVFLLRSGACLGERDLRAMYRVCRDNSIQTLRKIEDPSRQDITLTIDTMALIPLEISEIAGQMPTEVTDEALMAAAITEKPAGLMKTLFGPYITRATPAVLGALGPSWKAHGIRGTDWIDKIADISLFNRLHLAVRDDPHVETAHDDVWVFVKTPEDGTVTEEPEPGWELVPEASPEPHPQSHTSTWVLV